jgi:hypothetical protein
MLNPKYLLVAVGLLLLARPADAQLGAVADSATLALTGREVLSQAEQMVTRKMVDASNIASGLLNSALSGVNVSIEAARINATAAMDKPLREMQEGERTIFLSLRDATAQLDELSKKAYWLEEVSNVDISNRLGSLPLVSKATFISSVSGLSVVQGAADHRVRVIGTGLGPGEEGVAAKLELLLNGKPLVPQQTDSSAHNAATLRFAPEVFKPYFKPKQVVTLPVEVKLSVSRSRWYWFPETKVVDAKLLFTLYPEFGGTLRVEAEVPKFEWVTLRGGDRQGFRTADCGAKQCGGGGVPQEQWTTAVPGGDSPVVGYQRVANVRCECGPPWWAPDACRYSYLQECRPDANSSKVKLAWQQTGIWGTWYAVWDVQEYRRTGTTPMVLPDQDYFYGKSVSFCLPNTVDLYRVRLASVTKEKWDLTPQMSVPHRFEYAGAFTCRADEKSYEYRVPEPH